MKIKYCKLCKKILRDYNKSGICSNCGTSTYYKLIKKGVIK